MVERRGGDYDPSLLKKPQERITKKSPFLRKLEAMQKEEAEKKALGELVVVQIDRKRKSK